MLRGALRLMTAVGQAVRIPIRGSWAPTRHNLSGSRPSQVPRSHEDNNDGAAAAAYATTVPEIQKVSFDTYKTLNRNEVTLLGNLGSDVNVRTTRTGKQVGNVNLAVMHLPGEEVTTWYRLVLWEDAAVMAESQLAKGNQVWVRGRIAINPYQTAAGEARETLEVTVREIHRVATPGSV
ncbi:hypothetical protein FOA52_004842 [Chlamydomonas sp. UWO 241]|nr:hypothetical protein FOA52_004842 [Chlamydomonas sp. UWO 241]